MYLIKLSIYFIFDSTGSLLSWQAFLWLQQAGTTLHCGARAPHCGGSSCCRAQALEVHASVVVTQGHSCSVASGILLEEGLNPCCLHWQADYYPLHREEHATLCILKTSDKRSIQHIDGECHLGIYNDPMDFFFFQILLLIINLQIRHSYLSRPQI